LTSKGKLERDLLKLLTVTLVTLDQFVMVRIYASQVVQPKQLRKLCSKPEKSGLPLICHFKVEKAV
jgi:hypothetical protein